MYIIVDITRHFAKRQKSSDEFSCSIIACKPAVVHGVSHRWIRAFLRRQLHGIQTFAPYYYYYYYCFTSVLNSQGMKNYLMQCKNHYSYYYYFRGGAGVRGTNVAHSVASSTAAKRRRTFPHSSLPWLRDGLPLYHLLWQARLDTYRAVSPTTLPLRPRPTSSTSSESSSFKSDRRRDEAGPSPFNCDNTRVVR